MTQAIDFRFEILFLSGVLISVLMLMVGLTMRFSGRRAAGNRVLGLLAIGCIGYVGVVFAVAASTPQKCIAPGHELCFDEMCFAVVNLQTAQQLGPVRSHGLFYVVTVRVSSRARGRAQAELGLGALLWSPGHRYPISREGQSAWEAMHPESAPLTSRLQPGESILSDQVFDVADSQMPAGLVLTQGLTPGYLVIGECPLFHPPTILRLPANKK